MWERLKARFMNNYFSEIEVVAYYLNAPKINKSKKQVRKKEQHTQIKIV